MELGGKVDPNAYIFFQLHFYFPVEYPTPHLYYLLRLDHALELPSMVGEDALKRGAFDEGC